MDICKMYRRDRAGRQRQRAMQPEAKGAIERSDGKSPKGRKICTPIERSRLIDRQHARVEGDPAILTEILASSQKKMMVGSSGPIPRGNKAVRAPLVAQAVTFWYVTDSRLLPSVDYFCLNAYTPKLMREI